MTAGPERMVQPLFYRSETLGGEVKRRDEESSKRGLESDDLGLRHTALSVRVCVCALACICVSVCELAGK